MKIVLALLLFICFFPTYLLSEDLHTGQTILFLIYPFFICFIYLITRGKQTQFFIPNMGYYLLGFACIFIFTIISKLSFIDFKGMINHARFLAYAVIFCFSYNIAKNINLSEQQLIKSLYLLASLLILFVCMHVAIPNNAFVSSQTPRAAIDYTGFRIGGPLEWSYIFAFTLTPILILGIDQFLRGKKKVSLFILVSALFVIVMLAQSKAAYLATIVVLFLYTCFSFLHYKKNALLISIIVFVLSIAVYSFIAFSEQFAHIWGFIEGLQSGQSDASTRARVNQISTIEITLENAILTGYPIVYKIIENAYGHYLYYYGVIGLITYISFICVLWLDTYYKTKWVFLSRNGKDTSLALGMLAFITALPIYALSSSPTDAHKASYFFFTLFGIYFGVFDLYKDKLNSLQLKA